MDACFNCTVKSPISTLPFELEQSESMATSKCAVGPVIGRVTTTTARILVEVEVQVGKLTVSLSANGQVAKEVSRDNPPAGRAIVFAFDGLSEATKYSVRVSGDGKPIANCNPTAPSSFKTMSTSGQCRIAVVSCNKIYVSLKNSGEHAWGLLQHRVLADDLDCLLHVGDQVYADHEYGNFEKTDPNKLSEEKFRAKLKEDGDECIFLNAKMHLEGKGGYEQWAAEEELIKEMFRRLYRQTWSFAETAAVLANVPNTMLPDDHEFRDDWGDREEDYDRRSVSWFIARCGYRVFREYQAALSGGEGDSFAESSHSFHPEHLVLPDFLPQRQVALLALDTRCKAFLQDSYPYSANKLYPDPNKAPSSLPFLGDTQWADVSSALGDGGSLDVATHLLVATSCPMMYLGEKGTKVVTDFLGGDDFLGSWGAQRNLPELVKLLDLLRAWRARRPGRQVVLIGGDVHAGLITEVRHQGTVLCQQLTASPVSNKTLTPAMVAGQTFLQGATEDDFPGGYSVSHKSYEWRINFGTITIPDAAQPPAIQLHGAGETKPTTVVAESVGGAAGGCCSSCSLQ